MGNLFNELKRRKVFRVAAAYAVVAWLIIQVAGEILPTFNAPGWVNQTLVFLLMLGLPITLVIAWAFDLTPEGLRTTTSQNVVPAPQGAGQRLNNIMLGLVLLAVGFLVVDQYVLESENGAMPIPGTDSSLSRRFRIDIGETVPRSGPQTRATIALSADGSRLAYYVVRPDQQQLMYLLEMGQLEARILPALSDNLGNVFFSPDGEWLVHNRSNDRLYRTSVRGGAPQLLADSTWGGSGGYWAETGAIFYTSNVDDGRELMRLPANGGIPEVLRIARGNTDGAHAHAHLLPDGDSLLHTIVSIAGDARDGQVALFSLSTGESRTLIQAAYNARYVPTGHLVFMRSNSLWAVPFDLDSLETTGPEAPVIQGVETDGGRGGATYAFSNDGLLVYLPGTDSTLGGTLRTLLWVDRESNEQALDWGRDIRRPVISPDGQRLAAVVREGNNNDIWTYDLERDIPSRLTFDEEVDNNPLWTLDGESIVFHSSRDDGGLYIRAADGTGQAQPLLTGVPDAIPNSFTPDGSQLMYSSGSNLYILDMDGGAESRPLIQTEFDEQHAAISPDGRWIAYSSNESGEFEIYVRPFPDIDGGRWQVSNQGGVRPKWHPNSLELYFRLGEGGSTSLYSVRLAPESGFPAEAPQTVVASANYRGTGNQGGFDITPDGSRFLFIQQNSVTTDNYSEEFEAQTTQLIVVDNWFEELMRLAPADPQ